MQEYTSSKRNRNNYARFTAERLLRVVGPNVRVSHRKAMEIAMCNTPRQLHGAMAYFTDNLTAKTGLAVIGYTVWPGGYMFASNGSDLDTYDERWQREDLTRNRRHEIKMSAGA